MYVLQENYEEKTFLKLAQVVYLIIDFEIWHTKQKFPSRSLLIIKIEKKKVLKLTIARVDGDTELGKRKD
jgi:hypothetical protein